MSAKKPATPKFQVIQTGGDAFHVERWMNGVWCWWDGCYRHRSSARRAMKRWAKKEDSK